LSVSKQKQFLADVLESVPSIVFVLLWRQAGDQELAGWIGSGLALVAFFGLLHMRVRMNPVLLGVNVHLLLATPVIVGLFHFSFDETGRLFAAHAHGAVLVTVTVVGLSLSVFSRHGFVAADLPPKLRSLYSALMLAVSCAGAGWALLFQEQSFVAVIVTLGVLIFGRRFVLAKWADHSERTGAVVAVCTQTETIGVADVSV